MEFVEVTRVRAEFKNKVREEQWMTWEYHEQNLLRNTTLVIRTIVPDIMMIMKSVSAGARKVANMRTNGSEATITLLDTVIVVVKRWSAGELAPFHSHALCAACFLLLFMLRYLLRSKERVQLDVQGGWQVHPGLHFAAVSDPRRADEEVPSN